MIRINYKKDNTFGNTMYEFINNNLIMKWFTDRSGDLYWVLFTKNFTPDHEYSFKVGIQNYKFYKIIEQIYNDFKNGEMFYQSEIDSELKYPAATLNKNQYVRDLVREIFNSNTGEMIWYSDDDMKPRTNSFKILKEKDAFIIRFSDVVHGKLLRVCFKKNRGFYGPCSLPFFRAYENMDKIKDNYETSFEEYFDKVKPSLEETGDPKIKVHKKDEN